MRKWLQDVRGSRRTLGTQAGKEDVTVDFMSIQNLNSYIKNLKLQSQWSMKQQTGQYNAKGTCLLYTSDAADEL